MVFPNRPLLWYFSKSNFLFGWSRDKRCLKKSTIVEADPGPLLTAKMELFVTIVYGSKPYIIELSQRVPSEMLAEFLGCFFITNGIS